MFFDVEGTGVEVDFNSSKPLRQFEGIPRQCPCAKLAQWVGYHPTKEKIQIEDLITASDISLVVGD